MTTKVKFRSESIFSFDPKTDKSLFNKIKSYLLFNTVTFHLNKRTKLPEVTNLPNPTKLKEYLEKAIEIEFDCVSDEIIKLSYNNAITATEEYISYVERNPKINTQAFINFLEGERNRFQMLSKGFDVSSRLFFNSQIIIQLSDGTKNLPVTRYEYDSVGNDFLRGYFIFNMDIRKEFLQGITNKINDELEIAKTNSNSLRPLIERNPKLKDRYVFEYCEMLFKKGYLPDSYSKDRLSNILAKLFNLDPRKFDKAKVDYREAKIKYQVLLNEFIELSKTKK